MGMHAGITFNRAIVAGVLGMMWGGGGGEGFCCLYIENNTLQFYCPGVESGGGEGFTLDSSVTIRDLTFKGLPIVPTANDVDLKDVTVARAVTPGPTPGFKPEFDMLVRAKSDGAAIERAYARDLLGDLETSIEVTLGPDPTGLVDGVSAAYLRLEPPPGAAEGSFALQITATWNAAANGLTVSGSDLSGALGTPAVVPDTTSVLLQIRWNTLERTLSMVALGDEGIGYLFSDKEPRPDTPFQVVFGAQGLDALARASFTMLTFSSALLAAGSGEVPAGLYAVLARQRIEQAWTYALPPFAYPEIAQAELESALVLFDQAKELLGVAVEAGTVSPTTQTKLATRSLKRSTKRSQSSNKLATKVIDKGLTESQSLANKINHARWDALLLEAQLFGFKSKDIDAYFDVLDVNIPILPF